MEGKKTMFLKIAMWYVNRVANTAPSGIGHIDAGGKVVWPKSA
jgi:hypothetical protein